MKAYIDGSGWDLLLSELSPYGHARFSLNGEALFLRAKLAESLALGCPTNSIIPGCDRFW
jgi:hypothetical protein